MTNIHILPTDKPSRIYLIKSNNKLGITSNNPDFTENFGSGTQNQHIYITSDKEIKEGDWILDTVNDIIEKVKFISKGKLINGCWVLKSCKKIILTKDQDLIKDGVQSITDEFLEWFVKNPSCEEVEIVNEIIEDTSKDYIIGLGQPCLTVYKIIIPKEEICSFCDGTGQVVSSTTISRFKTCDCKMIPKEEPKQEQDKKLYSEEEVFNLLMEFSSRDINSSSRTPHSVANWFEQFKNK
jgi:hypothetical protein